MDSREPLTQHQPGAEQVPAAVQVPVATGFKECARKYKAEGLATVPLRLNDQGIAKIPVPLAWQTTTPETVELLDWSHAEGIGLVLGLNSCNRGAIDIDDVGLSQRFCAPCTDPPLSSYDLHGSRASPRSCR